MSQKLYNQLIAGHQGLGAGTMRDVILLSHPRQRDR